MSAPYRGSSFDKARRGAPVPVPPAGRRTSYLLYEPVCCIRVAAASPAMVLPLWKTAAFAIGATTAVRLSAANAANIRCFIRTLHLQPGGMPAWMDSQFVKPNGKLNVALQHEPMQDIDRWRTEGIQPAKTLSPVGWQARRHGRSGRPTGTIHQRHAGMPIGSLTYLHPPPISWPEAVGPVGPAEEAMPLDPEHDRGRRAAP